MPPYDAILFDFDGVLVDSEPIHFVCWRDILQQFGAELEWDTYERDCIGVADRAMLGVFSRLADPPLDVQELWRRYPAKQEAFRQRIAASPLFSPETLELVRSLDGYKLAVVSSSGRSEVEPPLVVAGIRARFGAVVCGEDVERHKPDPEPYLLAARLLNATQPLVVEDSVAGMASAGAAGFDALRVPHPSQMPALVRAKLGS